METKKYEGVLLRLTRKRKEDLKMPNHLLGHKRLYLQLHFCNVSDLLAVWRDLMPLALANSSKLDTVDSYAEVVQATTQDTGVAIEIDDVPYRQRDARRAVVPRHRPLITTVASVNA